MNSTQPSMIDLQIKSLQNEGLDIKKVQDVEPKSRTTSLTDIKPEVLDNNRQFDYEQDSDNHSKTSAEFDAMLPELEAVISRSKVCSISPQTSNVSLPSIGRSDSSRSSVSKATVNKKEAREVKQAKRTKLEKKRVKEWDEKETMFWLCSSDYEDMVAIGRCLKRTGHRINGRKLVALDRNGLMRLGISDNFGRFLTEINRLRQLAANRSTQGKQTSERSNRTHHVTSDKRFYTYAKAAKKANNNVRNDQSNVQKSADNVQNAGKLEAAEEKVEGFFKSFEVPRKYRDCAVKVVSDNFVVVTYNVAVEADRKDKHTNETGDYKIDNNDDDKNENKKEKEVEVFVVSAPVNKWTKKDTAIWSKIVLGRYKQLNYSCKLSGEELVHNISRKRLHFDKEANKIIMGHLFSLRKFDDDCFRMKTKLQLEQRGKRNKKLSFAALSKNRKCRTFHNDDNLNTNFSNHYDNSDNFPDFNNSSCRPKTAKANHKKINSAFSAHRSNYKKARPSTARAHHGKYRSFDSSFGKTNKISGGSHRWTPIDYEHKQDSSEFLKDKLRYGSSSVRLSGSFSRTIKKQKDFDLNANQLSQLRKLEKKALPLSRRTMAKHYNDMNNVYKNF